MSDFSTMRIPKYRKHTVRDFAFVEYRGERRRLPGRHNSPESRDAYRVLVGQILAGQSLPVPVEPGEPITVAILVSSYLDYAKQYYPGGARGEYGNCKYAMAPLVAAFGALYATSLGPLRLKELQQKLVAAGRSRTYINQCVAKIKRAYRWAASEELVPVESFQALATVAGLRAGRTLAVEQPKRRPVPWEHVEPVLAELPPVVAAMVMFQWLTGARSGSIVRATPAQFDRSGEVWIWSPRHKTEHLDKTVLLPIGPKCQEVLLPFMDREPDAYLFDPQSVRANRRYRERYASGSYGQAVMRALKRVNANRSEPIPLWSPHRMRHAKGHAIRAKHGAEAVQAVLGQDSLEAAELYSERRLALAVEIARDSG